ncbi:hypothetical protein [Alkaliphilus peptidifermentans]|uniref:Uncharacterized protein n=1 Tax=Alkaliphilus peptidifermentans DSM 18978 TaxID=1120976 RepID=A0A1G5IDY8_9FIRM|nr:hypothetical protein [Alkaliphilus peptidifermentans]SCY74306.1 hypothetical protein SAMN03080606_02368 [Alkaliphilus peptidifermentans DSM 18978]
MKLKKGFKLAVVLSVVIIINSFLKGGLRLASLVSSYIGITYPILLFFIPEYVAPSIKEDADLKKYKYFAILLIVFYIVFQLIYLI